MLTIETYVRARSLEEAYTLCQKKGSVVLGGMLWLRMQNRRIDTAIDLCDLGLDTIEETEDAFRLGAMVTLRQLEVHPGLAALTHGALADSLRPIVGVQFRNLATLGGSLWGRFGFSDVLTLFLALGAEVELYGQGRLPLSVFAGQRSAPDILAHVILPKTPTEVVYLSQRNTATDFPVLTCALARRGGNVVCALGARPNRAVLFRDETGILQNGITEESARAFGESVAERAEFGSNLRGSEAYRRAICPVLIRRGLMRMKEGLE